MSGKEVMAKLEISDEEIHELFAYIGKSTSDLCHITRSAAGAPQFVLIIAAGVAARVLVRVMGFLFGAPDVYEETKQCPRVQ